MRKSLKSLIIVASIVFCAVPSFCEKYERIKLWKNVSEMKRSVNDTVLYVDENCAKEAKEGQEDRIAVVICPGGSYHHLGMPHEGYATARWFKSKNIVPFVLRYRVSGKGYHYPAMLEDIQAAISYIRSNAEKYGISKDKIGAIGFSAGGHLVAMAGAFGDRVNEIEKLGITGESVAPNFVMPIYPVVTMQYDIGHAWSRKSLLGNKPSQETLDKFSMEMAVTKDMVPTFILACEDDPTVIYENSVRLDAALTELGVEHLFLHYEKGGHGFGMKKSKFLTETKWNDEVLYPWIMSLDL